MFLSTDYLINSAVSSKPFLTVLTFPDSMVFWYYEVPKETYVETFGLQFSCNYVGDLKGPDRNFLG